MQGVRRAVSPPGEAREDLRIIMELSNRMGYEMKYPRIEAVFQEMGMAWPAMGGMTYSRLNRGGLQWPCPTQDHPGSPYLFKGGFPRGKGRFTVVKYRPSVEETDEQYPFILTTGRVLFQYHTGTMTRRVDAINRISPEPFVEINPGDARDMAVEDGTMLRVTSRRGSIELKARLSKRPERGVVFIPFHFKEAAANVLTNSKALDPFCKIPELKVSTVRIEKV